MKNKIKKLSLFLVPISTIFIIYFIYSENKKEKKYLGNLRIDNSEGFDNLFLELKVPIQEIKKCKYVEFKVINENYFRK